jgi:hypothetical protein
MKTYTSGIVTVEWVGNCYAYQHKGDIVNITREKSGWIATLINAEPGRKGPQILPSVGKFKTLKSAFFSSIMLMHANKE